MRGHSSVMCLFPLFQYCLSALEQGSKAWEMKIQQRRVAENLVFLYNSWDMVIAPSHYPTCTHTCTYTLKCMAGKFKLLFLQQLRVESPTVGGSGRTFSRPLQQLPSWGVWSRGISLVSPPILCFNSKDIHSFINFLKVKFIGVTMINTII